MQFSQQVNTNLMKVNFITGVDRDTFGGALLYDLQRKKDTSISAQLLVIWGYRFNRAYSDAWLIEYESTFVWNEDKLRRLHDVYSSQHNINSNTVRWLLDDNTELETMCESTHGGFGMEVIISEEENQIHLIKPLWVNPNR
jgi:hypothetical protein